MPAKRRTSNPRPTFTVLLVAGLMLVFICVVLYYAANNYARSTPYFSGSAGVPAVVAVIVLIAIAAFVPVILHRRK